MKRLRILKLSLALCLLIENCIFAVNGVNISTYFLLLFYGLVRTEILFLRVKWKKLTFFEKFEKDVILLNIKETFFVDYFFGSLILCGYVSFSQLPRNDASKDINITYMYMFILVISISSYLNFSILRIQCINILPIRKFIKKIYREIVFFFFCRVLLFDINVNFQTKIIPFMTKRIHVNGH